MAQLFQLTDADRRLIADTVTRAEGLSDGEIVTVIARRSDAYHDVGLHWAIGTVFLALSVYAAFPAFYRDLILHLMGGWESSLSDRAFLMVLLCALIVKFLFVRYLLAIMPLRMALTPKATKMRRVRRRAVMLFRTAVEARTRASTGILLYVSMDEHRAEIVADAAINAKVAPEIWGDAMAALIDGVRAGQAGAGMAAAVEQVGAVLAEHFPRSAGDQNELPDRVIEI